MEVLRGVSAIYAKQNGINAINNKHPQGGGERERERERERETRKRDANIKGTEDVILLGRLLATLEYR